MCHGCFPLGQASRRLIHYTTLQYPTRAVLYKSVCGVRLSRSAFVIALKPLSDRMNPTQIYFEILWPGLNWASKGEDTKEDV